MEPSMKIGFFSQNRSFEVLFINIAEELGLKAIVRRISFNKAAKAALSMQNELDAVIARGGTAEYIKKLVTIPVVAIPLTAIDFFRSIYKAKSIDKTIGIITYKGSSINKNDAENMLGVKLIEYSFLEEEEIETKIIQAKNDGIRVIVGGVVASKIAEKHGIKAIVVECGEEAVRQSVEEAINLIKLRRMEIAKAAKFKATLDSIEEGIIVTNQSLKITNYNPAVKKIFHKTDNEMLNKSIKDIIPNFSIDEVLKTGVPQTEVVEDVYGGAVAVRQFPIKVEDKNIGVVATFEDITKIQILEQKIRQKIYKKGFVAKYNFNDIITVNDRMASIKNLAILYAGTDSSVLIQGESGTGKELFAQSIHNASSRKNGPFVAINCAAIPEQLLESELFGYEGGAFTGARREGKQGLFELAHNGTIFLDEIGEMPRNIQARLLRVIEEKKIMKIGGDKIIPVNIRVISATNKELKNQVREGSFREDLYYRLNVFSIKIPPLRERKDDIGKLAVEFLKKKTNLNAKINFDACEGELLSLLSGYDWLGNIRELNNVLERVALFVREDEKVNLKEIIKRVIDLPERSLDESISLKIDAYGSMKEMVDKAEKGIINYMMEKYNFNQEKVCDALGIGRTTLWRKIKE